MLTAVITNYKLNFNLLETIHGYTRKDKQKMHYTSLAKIESTTSIAAAWIRTCVLNDFTITKMFKPIFHLQYYTQRYSPTVLSVAKK